MKKKIVVIGFGFMGVVHAKNIIASWKLELCGIVDNRDGDIFAGIESTGNSGTLDVPLEDLRKVPVFKSIEECVDAVHPDAVSICVPLFLHHEMAGKALNLGLDVLLEKPFCPTPEQCREIIDQARAKDRILMVAHCIRFAPEWEFLAECIRDKRYGELQLLSTCRMGGEPAWGVWLDEKIKKTCGGSLLDLLIHDIDFANYNFGVPEDISINLNENEYWEIALEYPDNKAKVSIKGGFLHRHTTFAVEFAATFEHASIRSSTMQPGVIHIGTDAGAEEKCFTGDLYRNELDYFADCIVNRKAPERCLPDESMLAIELCKKIEKKRN